MDLYNVHQHFRDEIPCNTSDLFTTSQRTKHLCYKDHGSMPFMEIIVARFDVLTSLLMKIQMSRCVDWRIVTDVSNERSSF